MASLAPDLFERVGEKHTLTDVNVRKGATDYAREDAPSDNGKPESEIESEQYQPGVQRARAITTSWSRKTMWLMFVLLFVVSFVDILLTSVQAALNPYITSQFGRHGLLTSVSVISSILGGSSKLTLAKIIDIWGRIEGFLFMLLLLIIGMIMKATCTNIETYVAAHTLYWMSHLGIMYVIDIMLADMTTLRNRMLMYGINGTPQIASTFAGPRIAQLFYDNLNFRWAYGAFAFIMAGVCAPVAVVMLFEQRKALKIGVHEKKVSERSWWQSIAHYFIEFDVVGIILITAVFSLILLPFSIAPYAPDGWASGYIIAMLVLGVLCIPAFYCWERFFSPVQFLPWRYLKEPTLVGSCLLYCVMFISIFIWNAFFSSYLQVVHRLSITTSGYVLNSYSLTSAIFSPIVGLLISYTGNFKYIAYTGVPCILLGTALLIPFRQPNTHVGILVMTQILNGLGAGIFATCSQLAVMAPLTHQEIAAAMAIWGLFGSIGAAVGFAIAGAMWNNILPSELYNRLPEDAKAQAATIFGDITVQMGYADGSPERDAIVGAYADVQRKMVIAGACFVPLCLASIWIWRNINVKRLEKERGTQTRGTVF